MKRGALAVAALAALAALPSLPNGFVYDDVLLIQQNPLVHGLSRSAELWGASFWPAGTLYRPLTLQLFAAEWAVGGGRPLVFHLVSLLLYAAVAAAVFRLIQRVMTVAAPESQAATPLVPILAAGLFAVHPVHVEAVANVVGQSELLAGLFAVLAVERYLAWRGAAGLNPARRLMLALLTVLALLAKEVGFVTPLLLAAAELTLLRKQRAKLAPVFLLQASAVVLGLVLRMSAVGSLVGETPAVVLHDLSLPGRALAMLAVVPHWLRLLVWPAHLQATYGPAEIPVTTLLGPLHLVGLLLVLAVGSALVWSWKRSPWIAFALCWLLLALAPVSNLVAPTGLLLAERVLFLPSVGFALLLAALLQRVFAAGRPAAARAALGLAVVLLALGAIRSASRAPVWRTQEGFFRQAPLDAPRGYLAHLVAARYYYDERRFADAERAARRALELYPGDPQVHEQLGQALRVEGRCGEAVPILAAGVALAPDRPTVRSRLIECALAVGDTARARAAAAEAIRLGQQEFSATLKRLAP